MNKHKDTATGGPAFPFSFSEEARVSDGMTLRDYFAAKAMQALIQTKPKHWPAGDSESTTGLAYEMADEMLKAREA